MTRTAVALVDPRASQPGDIGGGLVLSPIVLAAIAIFIVNDHVLKVSSPSWFTGKLSDVAGLVFFPVLVAAFIEILLPATRPRRAALLIGTTVATGFVYIAMLLVPDVGEVFRWTFGVAQWPFRIASAWVAGQTLPDVAPVFFAADATDLATLPALLVPLLLARRTRRMAAPAN